MDEEILESFLTFIQRCNSEAVNSNDYNIIQNVFKYIGKKTFPSINELAREANVSKASISRFIKNIVLKIISNLEPYYQLKQHS